MDPETPDQVAEIPRPEERQATETHTDREGREASRRLRHGLISLAILVAIVVGLLLGVPGLHGVERTVSRMTTGWVLAAVGLEILSCLGYVLAFLQVFERAPIRFGARVALSELAFNAAVSVGGASSAAVGAWLLVERGAPVGRVAERSAVLFLYTSAINLIAFIVSGLLLFSGIVPGPSNPLLTLVPAAVGIVALIGFLLLPRAIDGARAKRLPRRLYVVLHTTAESIRDTKELVLQPDWRIIGAVAYLLCDIGVLLACFAAIGHAPSAVAVALAYQIAYLSNFIPVPGGIGVLDGSLVGMLVLYGVNATSATAAALVYHAIALWIPAVWGTLAFVLLRRSRRDPLKLRMTRSERRELRARREAPAAE